MIILQRDFFFKIKSAFKKMKIQCLRQNLSIVLTFHLYLNEMLLKSTLIPPLAIIQIELRR